MMKNYFVSIPMPPLFWGTWTLIGTVFIIDSLYATPVIAIWLLLALLWVIRASLSRNILYYTLIASAVIASTQYTYKRISFESFFARNTQTTGEPCLIEEVRINQLVDDTVAHPYALKLITLGLNSNKRFVITVPLKYPGTRLRAGQCVTVPITPIRQSKDSVFNRYLLKISAQASMFLTIVPHRTFCRLLSLSLRIKQKILKAKERLMGTVQRTFTKPTAYLVSLIFLGKTPFAQVQTGQIREEFATWGVVHFIARAGLHLVVLFSALSFFLALFGLAPLFRTLILMFFIYWYAMVSWLSLPFLRALFSTTLTTYAVMRGFITKPLDIISLAAYAMIMLNPFVIFFLDFQLSFGITALLCWMTELKNIKTVAS